MKDVTKTKEAKEMKLEPSWIATEGTTNTYVTPSKTVESIEQQDRTERDI